MIAKYGDQPWFLNWLGRMRTTNVEKIRVTDVITGNEDTPLEEMARLMIRYDVDHIPVVRDGVPIGIVA